MYYSFKNSLQSSTLNKNYYNFHLKMEMYEQRLAMNYVVQSIKYLADLVYEERTSYNKRTSRTKTLRCFRGVCQGISIFSYRILKFKVCEINYDSNPTAIL